ncbi:GIY-YIG nuclease family protein [Anaerobium acetethylicum]|uniref:Putative endonuclease n=1 Tax=Anaerobium acetethylicum TaxID=1619234 RepID=A0A1D3TSC6_9FIRM|nr:putative endonuclease [Anaerobium acetethylicum]
MNYTYILKCSDESLYTGWTNNLEKRIADHNSGKGAKYTRGRGPVSLLYYETFETREEAMRRENEIKKLGRNEKIRLTAGFENPDPA